MSYIISAIFLVLIIIDSESKDYNSTEQNAAETGQTAFQINFSNDSVVLETQHAMCSVTTEEVAAKAQATASRILTGICTSEEMYKAIRNMEKNILEKLEQVQEKIITVMQSQLYPNIQKKEKNRSSKFSPFKTIEYLFDENIFKKYDYD